MKLILCANMEEKVCDLDFLRWWDIVMFTRQCCIDGTAYREIVDLDSSVYGNHLIKHNVLNSYLNMSRMAIWKSSKFLISFSMNLL